MDPTIVLVALGGLFAGVGLTLGAIHNTCIVTPMTREQAEEAERKAIEHEKECGGYR